MILVCGLKPKIIFFSFRPSQSTAPNVAIYEVPSASKSDSGTYQCSANNAAGKNECRPLSNEKGGL